MKTIRNETIHWRRLADLINQIASARKKKQKTSDLEREARMERSAIIRCELRQERRAA